MKFLKLVAIVFSFFFSIGITAQDKSKKRYIKVPEGYLMVLLQGDIILKELETFAIAEKIPSANFTGMGFVTMTFGYYDFKKKKFNPKEFKNVELASMNGTIAWQKEEPSIHAHGVVTDENFNAFGGHILEGTVETGSLEVMILVHHQTLERKHEEYIGANVLCIDKCK
jgi:predicted DNA-binding protein with PD1-like motif